MRHALFAAVSAVALALALPVLAQETGTELAYQTPGTLRSDRSFTGAIAGSYTAGELIGTSIVNSEGKEIAKIGDLVISADDNVRYVLADVGNFLAVGTATVAIDVERLQPAQGSGNELMTDMTEEELSSMPSYEPWMP